MVAVLVLDFVEEVPVASESGIGFGAALDGAGFASAGAKVKLIASQLVEQIGKELATKPWTTGLRQRLGETASSGQGPGKTEALARNAVEAGALQHEAAGMGTVIALGEEVVRDPAFEEQLELVKEGRLVRGGIAA